MVMVRVINYIVTIIKIIISESTCSAMHSQASPPQCSTFFLVILMLVSYLLVDCDVCLFFRTHITTWHKARYSGSSTCITRYVVSIMKEERVSNDEGYNYYEG